MKSIKKFFLVFSLMFFVLSCDFLDMVPDETPTLDHAFTDEFAAENYLYTCYAGLPVENSTDGPAFLGSDEFWAGRYILTQDNTNLAPFRILLGEQDPNSVKLPFYSNMWETIRKTYVFQENIETVVHLSKETKDQWIAESKCIAAYCYYVLLRNYGPVAIIDEMYDLDVPSDEIRLPRATFDEGVNFVVSLLDLAVVSLPEVISDRAVDLGRFTTPIAKTLKAKLLTMAASPMYNGNPYYANWTNKDGKELFSPRDEKKWNRALEACEDAIEMCHRLGVELYEYPADASVSEARRMEHTIRETVSSSKWNAELIWGDVRANTSDLQIKSLPRWTTTTSTHPLYTVLNVPLKMVKEFYTKNGIPIEEDPEWDGVHLFEIGIPESKFSDYVDITEEQPRLNLDREPRFYGALAFNRAKWYGSGKTGNDSHILKIYNGEYGNLEGYGRWMPGTGYLPRKLANIETTMSGTGTATSIVNTKKYPFPLLRLADLYLLHSECSNEVNGPTPESKKYIDLVRKRAGLEAIDIAWTVSTRSDKPHSKDGLREIIHQERLIELAFEGHRFWDIRRWLKLETLGNQPLSGLDVNQKRANAEKYYQEMVRFTPSFSKKDYLWPLSQDDLLKNPNLVQSKGW